MHKIIGVISLAAMFIGCSREFNSNSNDDSDSASKDLSSRFVNIPVSTPPDTTPLNSMTLDILCPNALPGNQNWSRTLTIDAGEGKNPSFSLLKNVKCTITLKKYKDSLGEFIPINDPLIITISESGLIQSTKAIKYSNNKNFAAGGIGLYSLLIAYHIDATEAELLLENKPIVNLNINSGSGPSSPTAKNLKLSITPENSEGKKDYSLFAEVGNYKKCKIIAASQLDDFNYNSIHKLFQESPKETICPENIFSGSQGNWNSFISNEQIIFLQNLDETETFASYRYILIQKQE